MNKLYIVIILLLVFYYIYMNKMNTTTKMENGDCKENKEDILEAPIVKEITDYNLGEKPIFVHEDLLPINRNPNKINVKTPNYTDNYILPELLPIAKNNGHKTLQKVNKKCDKCKYYAKEYCTHYNQICHGNEVAVGNYNQTVNNSMFNKNNECGCNSDYVCQLHYDTSKTCMDGTYNDCADNFSLFNQPLTGF